MSGGPGNGQEVLRVCAVSEGPGIKLSWKRIGVVVELCRSHRLRCCGKVVVCHCRVIGVPNHQFFLQILMLVVDRTKVRDGPHGG